MTVAVLALQGAFIEHEHVLEELGVKTVELRQAADLDQPYDGLILPGGESTVQGKLLRELKMFDPLKKQIADGMPVLCIRLEVSRPGTAGPNGTEDTVMI